MTTWTLRLPDDLAAKADAARRDGEGRSAFMRRLIEASLSEVPGQIERPESLSGQTQPRSEQINFRLRADELAALDKASSAAGFRRATWMRALVRRKLLNQPVMNDAQAHAFRGVQRELQRIGVNVNQIARAVNTAIVEGGQVLGTELQWLNELAGEIRQQKTTLREAFRGNLDYWDDAA